MMKWIVLWIFWVSYFFTEFYNIMLCEVIFLALKILKIQKKYKF